MSDEDDNIQFRQMADAFIDPANKQSEDINSENVSMALLYAASRYNSFIVANHAENLEKYEEDRKRAIEFFSSEYLRMLNENLDDYKKTFDPDMKYQHLVKNH